MIQLINEVFSEQDGVQLGVKLKHNPNKAAIKNKKLILVDDSIVRGTTSKKIVSMLYDAGAKEVHMKISSPPIKYPDYYGIDTPNVSELLAANNSIEEMRKIIGVKTLAFLSIDGVYKALGHEKVTTTSVILLPSRVTGLQSIQQLIFHKFLQDVHVPDHPSSLNALRQAVA